MRDELHQRNNHLPQLHDLRGRIDGSDDLRAVDDRLPLWLGEAPSPLKRDPAVRLLAGERDGRLRRLE